MQPATAPYILRALYKDEHIVNTHVMRPLSDLVTATLGAHATNSYDRLISNVAKGLYVFFALLRGQTLGEEFCDLLPVTPGSPPRLLRVGRKGLLALLFALEPVALFHFAVRAFPSVPPHDVVANVKRGVTALLFLFERYGTLPHRLVRVRALSLLPSRVLDGDDGAPRTYLVLGVVLLLELALRLRRFLAERRGKGRRANAGDGAAERDDSEADDERRAAAGRCMLCLGHRTQPTATLCGHIFCWRCLAEWNTSNTKGVICPFCRRHITMQSSVPLFFYVAKEPPTVGGGGAGGANGATNTNTERRDPVE